MNAVASMGSWSETTSVLERNQRMDVEVALPNITAARALRTCLQDPDWRARLGFQPEGVEIETMLGASRTAIALRFVCEFGVAVVSGAAGNALYDAITHQSIIKTTFLLYVTASGAIAGG
jgi:hypothetical protein